MTQNEYSRPSFVINGMTITWREGVVSFPRYGVKIKIPYREFTLEWAKEMEGKLAALSAAGLLKKPT